ncbi:MAG: hypothetical protein IPK21_19440 [Haliscomenobacter sp.]|nr:hypothetical protein [Haliscomenobacter sp.]
MMSKPSFFLRPFAALLVLGLFYGNPPLQAQKRLEGLFQGELTIGGLGSSRKIKVEMYLKINKRQVEGRSYVHLAPGKTVEMHLQGVFYDDFSIYLEEVQEIAPGAPEQTTSPYPRKYQLRYSGHFDEVQLTGFWQQVIDTPFDKKRHLGRIKLVKVQASKA